MSNEITSALARDGVISTTQLLMVVITILIAVLCITNPLKKIIEQLNQLTDNLENNQGNLEERIETKKTDEIGKMVSGINLYMDKLQLIMKQIQNCSTSLDGSCYNISSKVSNSKNEAEVVRKQAEELYGQIQIFATEIHSMISEMGVLNQDSKSISEIAVSGKSYSLEMKERAGKVRVMADNNKEESKKVADALREGLQASVENSRNTANSIQEISSQVMMAVKSLSDASEKLLAFVDTDVSKAYDEFVTSAEEYLKDANQIETMMNTFDEKAAFFLEATSQMNEKLNEVSQEATCEKESVGTLSEAVNDLAENVSNILEDTAVNDKVSDELKQEILKFKEI